MVSKASEEIVRYLKANPNLEVSAKEIGRAINRGPNEFTSILSSSYFECEGDWAQVFRTPGAAGAYMYRYDPSLPARLKEPRTIHRKGPYKQQPPQTNGYVESGFMLEYLRVLGNRHLFTGEDGTLWVATKVEI